MKYVGHQLHLFIKYFGNYILSVQFFTPDSIVQTPVLLEEGNKRYSNFFQNYINILICVKLLKANLMNTRKLKRKRRTTLSAMKLFGIFV